MFDTDLDILQEWRQFRADMAKGDNLGRWLELKAVYKTSSKDVTEIYLRELVNEENPLSFPSPGSSYWSSAVDIPGWFYRYLTGNVTDPVSVLKAAKRDKKRKVNKAVKRLQVGRVVMKKRCIS